MSDDTQLIVLPLEKSALYVFTTDGAMPAILADIKKRVDTFVPDMATAKGRRDIAAFAYKVVQSKTYLEGIGKALADEQKAIPKKIDAARKLARDTLDKWAEEVRAPLTKWEEAETDRVRRHETAIEAFTLLSEPATGLGSPISADGLKKALQVVESKEVGPRCEEYEAAYAEAKAKAVARLTDAIAARTQYEADQDELTAIRAVQAERDNAASVERARLQRAADDAWRVEQAEKMERAAAERRELNATIAAEVEKRKAAEAEVRQQKEAQAAIERDAAETARRNADVEHKRAINKTVVEWLALKLSAKAGLDVITASKEIVSAIVMGEIKNLTITY